MKRRMHSVFLLPAAALLLATGPVRADETRIADKQHLGAATCASTVCHGKLERQDNNNVWLNEYRIWLRAGKHSGAYRLLENEESRRIANYLGLASATTAKVCLDCHADNVPTEKRGLKFQITDGVSCEACHGGAEDWIESHALESATHADNLASGMYPTEAPTERAKLCLSCHMGNAEKFAGHDIMGAGHPRLSFELEAFQTNQPAHFDVDADYRERKGEIPSFKLWLAGQLESALRLSELVRTRIASGGRPYPELALYDCHACHHPMDDRRWAQSSAARNLGPGLLRLQDQHLNVLKSAALVLASTEARAELAGLQTAFVAAGTDNIDAAVVAAGRLSQWLRMAQREWLAQSFTRDQVRAVRRQIVSDAARGSMSDFSAAEQVVLALETLSYALDDWDRVSSAMDRIFEQVVDDASYSPASFAATAGGILEQF